MNLSTLFYNKPNKVSFKFQKRVILKDRLATIENFDLDFNPQYPEKQATNFGYQNTQIIRFNEYFNRET